MKQLYIIRGLPGVGKTTLAQKLAPYNFYEADQYFIDRDGVYTFNKDKISNAHSECQQRVDDSMYRSIPIIVVSNTFVKRWEMQPYLDMACKYGYQVTEITLSGPLHGNIHEVPDETIERMRASWEK